MNKIIFKKKQIKFLCVLTIFLLLIPVTNGQILFNNTNNEMEIKENNKHEVFQYNGTLSGYVTDSLSNPIDGALVRVHFHGTYEEDYSDENGYYHVTNIPICYCMKNCTCSKEGYTTEWVLMGIAENTTHDFVLYQLDVYPVFNGSKCNGWWNSPITVSFVFDPEVVAEIWYEYHGWHLYKEPFIIDELEPITVTVYWIDFEGQQSPYFSFDLEIDRIPPIIDVTWEVYKKSSKWYVKFDIIAVDSISGIDSFLQFYINDVLHAEFEVIDWSNVEIELPWSKNLKYFTFGFGCSDIACNYIIKNVNGSDIKSKIKSINNIGQNPYICNMLKIFENFPIIKQIYNRFLGELI